MNLEQQYLSSIIQAYETELNKSNDARAFKVLSLKGINDLKSVTSFSKKSINSFSGTKYDFESNPDEAKNKKEFNVDTLLDNLKKIDIELIGGDLGDYIEKCFNCELRLKWDWQFLPPDVLLNPLDLLMDEILKALSFLEKVINGSQKKLEQLCYLPLLFNGIPCPQDILALILSLKILLDKYKVLSLKLKIDWMALFAPFVMAIVSLLSYLVDLIFSALSAPLACTLSVMSSGLEYARLINSALFSTPNVKSDPSANKVTEILTEYNEVVGERTTTSIASADEVLGSKITSETKTNLETIPASNMAIATGVETGFTIENFFNGPELNKPNWFDLSLLEQIYVGTVEAKDWLNFYKRKIDELLAAFLGLVKGKKLLDIQNMSIIIVIIELISLLVLLLQTDLTTLCEAKDKSKLEHLMKSFLATTDDSLDVSVETNENGETLAKISNGSDITIVSCSKANTSEDLKAIEDILSEIERLTRNG